ncbi:M20 metallopeptidase family protein [Faecalicatena contorta]|uniref:M20 metallopeptidase family protein n=1 Tax=Lachnospiraceae TaxID=186803 RepID=UPI001F31E468|nr:M20 family metallopeptidase [Faecalicatena contorta]MCF2668803.1 amidohydrolase [Faecalicatena contorta]
MGAERLLEEAKMYEQQLIEKRRYLHQHAETEFDLHDTVAFVKAELQSMGYEPQECGKAGLIVNAGGKRPGKVFLIRGDMDALPMAEQAEVDFPSETGKMHACGHDMHTTMMLGAAKLLKEHEDEIEGTVKLMFQPAEEIFEGAHDMIEAGVLKNPDVDAALMIHVMAGQPFTAGTVIVSDGGISAPGADYFRIHIQGKGCHGSMPNAGVDSITVAAHIITALQEIHARELGLIDEAVLTIGKIQAGQAANVIPDTLDMEGTIRTYDEEVRAFIKQRMTEISQGIASSFRAEAEVIFGKGCPVLKNDGELSKCAAQYVTELLGQGKAFTQGQLLAMAGEGKAQKAAGSEDFAYVSQEVPSIMLALAAGEPAKGYAYPQHHPKVKFDESVLSPGSAVYAYTAMRWLEEHK